MNYSYLKKTTLLTVVITSAAVLFGCHGGGSSSSAANVPANVAAATSQVTLPLSDQLVTPISASFASNNSGVSTQKATQAATVGGDSCFILVPASGKNYTSSVNSSPWWSTATVSFTVKNTCATPASATSLIASIQGLKINGSPVNTLADVSQTGAWPWSSISSSLNGSVANLNINTPSCVGDYCSWAQASAGASQTFSLGVSLGAPINSLEVSDVVLNGSGGGGSGGGESGGSGSGSGGGESGGSGGGSTPVEPSTGTLGLTINTSQLSALCQSSSNAVGELKVLVKDPSGISQVDAISIDPCGYTTNPYKVSYANLLPGNYTIQVDSSGLPKGVGYNTEPGSGVVDLPITGGTVSGSVNLTYTKPDTAVASLNINLEQFPDLDKFSQANGVDVQLTDTNSGQKYQQNLPLNGSKVTFSGLNPDHHYDIVTQGLGDAYSGTFYSGASLTNVSLNEGTNSEALSLTKVDARHGVKFLVSGYDNQQAKVTFTNNGDIKTDFYVYVPGSLVNNHTYLFPDSEIAAVNITNIPAGSSVVATPNVVSSQTSQVSVVFSAVVPPITSANKEVTVYLLIDTPQELQQYTNDLQAETKVNFNRVIFSFVRPTLPVYTSGSLANTGIMGYFENGDGKGVDAFNQLKAAVELSKAKNIQPFLSVGGWNYSCNFAVYGNNCGDTPTAANGIHYDYFPDPLDPNEASLAATSYANIIKLTNDLGMQGIDLDAEEFWHADKYAQKWNGDPWNTSLGNTVNSSGGPSYNNLVKYGSSGSTTAGPAIMPKTVDKTAAIIHELKDNQNAKDLMFATAAPPVGARPITGFVYGDTAPDIYTKGGVWWLGNLKGLWYNLADKDKSVVDRFDSIGLMTYDLCGDNATTCAPYGGAPLDLASQVDAYMKDYTNWLKATTPSAAKLTVDNIGKVEFLPAKYYVSSKIQFGFEVNQPAYPKNAGGQLQLTNALVDTILGRQKDSDGVIIWQMYSKPNNSVSGRTNSHYTISQSCKTFLVNDSRYDCNSQFPRSAQK